jgi:predicted dehydrogenase
MEELPLITKCLIIGLGQIGMGYDLHLGPSDSIYTHARALSRHPKFELVGAIDSEKSRRDHFEAIYDLPAYSDIASALRIHEVSLIVIALPTILHYSTIKKVLAHASLKIILCEKPLAYDLNEARQIVESCEGAGIKLFVNYMRRADPGVLEIKNRIEIGQIAYPIKGIVWYSKGFLHNGSHFFNLLEFWLGPYVGARLLDVGRNLGSQDCEPDVQVEFKGGKVVFLAAWEEAYSHYSIELLSSSGRLRYEEEGQSIYWQSIMLDKNFPNYRVLKTEYEKINSGMNFYQWHVADQLDWAINNKVNTLSTGRQSLVTLEAMHKIIITR